jgi:peptide/nickel transport system substrate-binding protein
MSAAVFAAGMALAGADAVAQKRGGSLVYANVSAVGTMDPYAASAVVDLEVIHHVYEAMVEMGEAYDAVPGLATKIDTSEDARTFTFTLRKGVKFSNGKEMTSGDAVASFERYKKVSPNAVALGDVASMETPDPHTFVVKLNKPNAFFIEIIKTPTYPFSIIPAEQKDKPARELDIVGTGPYQVGEWLKDDHLTLRRFDGYVADDTAKGPNGYAGKRTAWLDTIRYNAVPEANARLAALQSGGANFVAQVLPDMVKRIEGRPDLHVLKVIPFCQQEFILHAKNPPSTNQKVRQAIAALIDADEIVAASGQIAERNPSLMFKTSAYWSEVAAPWYDQKSVEKAKSLLKDGGYKGEKIVVETNANYTYMRDGTLVLTEAMKQAGMNVDLKMVDWTTNVTDMSKGTGGWNVSTTGFCSGPLLGPQQWRLSLAFAQNTDDPVLVDGYSKLFATNDLNQRKAIWQGIEKYMVSEGYMIKVADLADLRGYDDKFENIKPYYMQRFWDVWVK